LIVVN